MNLQDVKKGDELLSIQPDDSNDETRQHASSTKTWEPIKTMTVQAITDTKHENLIKAVADAQEALQTAKKTPKGVSVASGNHGASNVPNDEGESKVSILMNDRWDYIDYKFNTCAYDPNEVSSLDWSIQKYEGQISKWSIFEYETVLDPSKFAFFTNKESIKGKLENCQFVDGDGTAFMIEKANNVLPSVVVEQTDISRFGKNYTSWGIMEKKGSSTFFSEWEQRICVLYEDENKLEYYRPNKQGNPAGTLSLDSMKSWSYDATERSIQLTMKNEGSSSKYRKVYTFRPVQDHTHTSLKLKADKNLKAALKQIIDATRELKTYESIGISFAGETLAQPVFIVIPEDVNGTWGFWNTDPNPSGISIDDYKSGVMTDWQHRGHHTDFWVLNNNTYIIPNPTLSPKCPLPAGKYVVRKGDDMILLTIHQDQSYDFNDSLDGKGQNIDLSGLTRWTTYRTARYTKDDVNTSSSKSEREEKKNQNINILNDLHTFLKTNFSDSKLPDSTGLGGRPAEAGQMPSSEPAAQHNRATSVSASEHVGPSVNADASDPISFPEGWSTEHTLDGYDKKKYSVITVVGMMPTT